MNDRVYEYLLLLGQLDELRESRTLTNEVEDELDGKIEALWLQMTDEERRQADDICERSEHLPVPANTGFVDQRDGVPRRKVA